MKKIVSVLLCLAMLGGLCAYAEEGDVNLGIVGNSQVAYSITCQTPKQFTVFHKQGDNQTIEGMLANDKPTQASYLFVIALDREFAGIESLGAADTTALNSLTAAYEEEGLAVTVKEQNGEKYMCLADQGAKKNTFASVETVIHGCLIQISIAPVQDTVSAMTEKQAQTAIDFLATLAFAPADPIPGEDPEEEAEEEEAISDDDEKTEDEELISDTVEEETEAAPAETTPVLVGGWQVNEEPVSSLLTEDEQKVFDQVVAATGMDYEPAAVLATQVVAGTNYAYLCQEKDGDQEWIIVTVFSGLNGETQVLNAHVLALYNLLTTDKPMPLGLAGGWTLREAYDGALLPEEAQAAFTQAAEAANEAFSPIALLGTQVVAGTNYKVLARGEAALYLVDVYAPLAGDASITGTAMLDLLSYVSVN